MITFKKSSPFKKSWLSSTLRYCGAYKLFLRRWGVRLILYEQFAVVSNVVCMLVVETWVGLHGSSYPLTMNVEP